MLKYVAPKCAEILYVWTKDFKKAYLHGEHMLVICSPLATLGQESRGEEGKEEGMR